MKTWEKTRLQNLVRHKSGRYYARLYLNGKEVWKSLKTANFSVAETRLATLQKEHRARRDKEVDSTNAKMTFGDASTLHMQHLDGDVSLKRRTRTYLAHYKRSLTQELGWIGKCRNQTHHTSRMPGVGNEIRKRVQFNTLQRCALTPSTHLRSGHREWRSSYQPGFRS